MKNKTKLKESNSKVLANKHKTAVKIVNRRMNNLKTNKQKCPQNLSEIRTSLIKAQNNSVAVQDILGKFKYSSKHSP
ncbi:hypothetical protein BC829DRAFT_6750 [Chytridium lagenaria]|nr:hypothetical protein BC829DRAFT_6750 [Chytridium lagenaria]